MIARQFMLSAAVDYFVKAKSSRYSYSLISPKTSNNRVAPQADTSVNRAGVRFGSVSSVLKARNDRQLPATFLHLRRFEMRMQSRYFEARSENRCHNRTHTVVAVPSTKTNILRPPIRAAPSVGGRPRKVT